MEGSNRIVPWSVVPDLFVQSGFYAGMIYYLSFWYVICRYGYRFECLFMLTVTGTTVRSLHSEFPFV